ncbi:MAG TPA: hypothetical protein PKD79_03780 [Candidatus Doudnabacteria bacterium]|mgnify:CR=1 FL=1|nr:hypothetical protein [Candidatus Doudnabacteria bacterium]
MKYFLLAVLAISLMAGACDNTKIEGKVPTSPKESYQPLPD